MKRDLERSEKLYHRLAAIVGRREHGFRQNNVISFPGNESPRRDVGEAPTLTEAPRARGIEGLLRTLFDEISRDEKDG